MPNTTRNISRKFITELDKTRIVPKKQLGQVFLADPNIIRKITTVCDLKKDETVVEIGAGTGALTHHLAPKVHHLIAIETDRELAQRLQAEFEKTNVTIIHADFLKYDLNLLPPGAKIIGNLPYYISTPIIAKVLLEHKKISQFFCMVQWEYGQRLVAQPNTKAYGSFSCFAQYYSNVEMLFKIKNSSFRPVPKINSCFLKFSTPDAHQPKARNELLLFNIIRSAFQQRRKTILNALSQLIEKKVLLETLESLSINPQSRAENLSVENFIQIANALDGTKP